MIATLRKDDGGMKPMKNKIYLQLFAEGAGEAGGAEVETGLERVRTTSRLSRYRQTPVRKVQRTEEPSGRT